MGFDILLVRPESDKRLSGAFSSIWKQPPMNLFYLRAFIESRGFSAKLIDYDFGGYSKDAFSKELSVSKPRFVGVSAGTFSLECSREIVRLAKEFGARTVLGGANATISGSSLLLELGADFLVLNEGELALESLLRGRSLPKIGGILARKGRKVLSGRKERLPEGKDLDSFGFPDRTGKEFRKYDSCASAGVWEKTAFITASRGCPYNCTFCISTVIHGKAWRARSVESVLREVENCIKAGYSHIQFDDDVFGFSEKWFRDFCRGMIGKGHSRRITWDYSTRADLTSPEKFRMARKAGAVKVGMGVESGSERILKSIRKGEGSGRMRRAFSDARKAGLLTESFFVLGFFGETLETLKETEKLLFEISPDVPVITLLSPFPGTEEHRRFRRAGALGGARIPAGFFTDKAQAQGTLESEKLVEFRNSLYRKYTLRPSFALRTLSQARSADGLFRIFLAGLSTAFG